MNLFKLLFLSRADRYRKTKAFFGFFYGLFLGLGLYEIILIDLDFTAFTGQLIGLIISLMLAFGIAISLQIRCICLLVLPVFAGRAGRGVLKAIILAYVISGPVENLTNNGREVVRTFACITSLTYNLTKTRFELMFKPFTQALFGMKTDVNEVKDTLRSVRDLSGPIAGEMEDDREVRRLKEQNDYLDDLMNDTKRSKEVEEKYESIGEKSEAQRYEKNYLKKIELRCEEQFTSASERCRNMFSKAYDKCYDAVTWIAAWLLCWPMKLDFVCNIAQALGGANRCDPSKEMDPGFGEGYEYLKRSQKSLRNNLKDVRMQYKFFKFPRLEGLRQSADAAKQILHDVQSRKDILDSILLMFKRLLAFMFLRILMQAQQYHDSYLRDIEYDNVYITKYFRKIDARRKFREQMVLFPLKKFERTKIIALKSKKLLKSEKQHVLRQIMKIFIELVFATTFIMLDRLFYEALDLVRRHAKIEYTQTGHHDMLLEIKGTGMIASLLRSLVKGFNIKKRIKLQKSNEICLPQPKLLAKYYLYKIYGTYALITALMIVEAYTQRMRRTICAYFYRKREKRRILYLYNETLRRRIGFFRHMHQKMTRLVRERRLEETGNVFAEFRSKYPKVGKFLKILGFGRRKCAICEEEETCRTKEEEFVQCQTEGCYLVYCRDCWGDLDEECLACSIIDEESSEGEESEEEEDEDD